MPTTYEAAARRPSRRALRDEQRKVAVARVHEANYGVCGPRKVRLALNRAGVPVARCVDRRLTLGLRRPREHLTRC
jgi:putative transposase